MIIAREAPSVGEAAAPGITDQDCALFRDLVYANTGIALGPHKQSLLRARLDRRLRALGLSSFSAYYGFLMEQDPAGEELGRLINAITTNKTDFFRERHHFGFLSREVLGPLAARAKRGGPRRLRIWSAGCSSGEEPYSIAMTVLAGLPTPRQWDVKILASDIDTDMLAKGKDGVYAEDRVGDVPRPLLERYFLRGKGSQAGLVRVRREVRDLVGFRRINLRDQAWPIRATFDAIFCRNVVIYFDRTTQRTLFDRLAGCLAEGGHLFIGHSESLYGISDRFVSAGPTVYRKVALAEDRRGAA